MSFFSFLEKIMLSKAMKTIVQGIKNSTQSEGNLNTSNALKTNVKECPIVNAVTRIKTFFQSLKLKIAMSAKMNN